MGGMRALSLIKIPVSGGGGTTSPGGADTDVQYNNGGAFGGDANFTWNHTSQILSVTGTTLLNGNATVGEVLNVGENIVVANSIQTLTSGLIDTPIIEANPVITNNGAILEWIGMKLDPNITANSGLTTVTGYWFIPTITGTPASLIAFYNTIGSNLFNTLGGNTTIGPSAAVGAAIFQVYGDIMHDGKISIGAVNPAVATATVQIVKPGTAAAGDGQFKLATDTALKTVPEEGLFELNGGHLYVTIGGTRHTLV
jgi:hypothetical protein